MKDMVLKLLHNLRTILTEAKHLVTGAQLMKVANELRQLEILILALETGRFLLTEAVSHDAPTEAPVVVDDDSADIDRAENEGLCSRDPESN